LMGSANILWRILVEAPNIPVRRPDLQARPWA
jgi:hypothetical protein